MTVPPPSSSASQGKPLLVGITGASGSILGLRLVRALLAAGVAVGLILTEKSRQVIADELPLRLGGKEEEKIARIAQFLTLTDAQTALLRLYENHRLDAPPASGTFRTRGMVIAPCSMGTLGRIAAGISDNLIARAADVTLKECRPLILLPRETPLNRIHLRNMTTVCEAGGVMLPPMLSFYLPAFHSLDGQIDLIIGKTFDLLGLEHSLHPRWGQPAAPDLPFA